MKCLFFLSNSKEEKKEIRVKRINDSLSPREEKVIILKDKPKGIRKIGGLKVFGIRLRYRQDKAKTTCIVIIADPRIEWIGSIPTLASKKAGKKNSS